MANNERARQAQFELMLSYMEQHGDIQCLSDRIESHIRWIELTKLLNNKSLGEPKPVEKWRKCWSDFKNNTKKKEIRIKKKDCRVDLSKLEKRLLELVENQKSLKRKAIEMDNDNSIVFKQSESVCEEDQMLPSPSNIRDIQCESAGHRKSSTSSSISGSSNEESPTPGKRRFKDSIKDVADKYLEFEREREKLAHDREMARIKQNDKLIMIFGKVVNVLEMLTPNIQKHLDRSTNDDR